MPDTRKKQRLRPPALMVGLGQRETNPKSLSGAPELPSSQMLHSVSPDSIRIFPVQFSNFSATSHLTGFVIRRLNKGCFLGYISQTDPRGKLPPWLVNKITQKFAPRVVKQLLKAAEGYESWKCCQRNPNYKPWVYPEQTLDSPRISITDVSY